MGFKIVGGWGGGGGGSRVIVKAKFSFYFALFKLNKTGSDQFQDYCKLIDNFLTLFEIGKIVKTIICEEIKNKYYFF
jgi:hypothetical protein